MVILTATGTNMSEFLTNLIAMYRTAEVRESTPSAEDIALFDARLALTSGTRVGSVVKFHLDYPTMEPLGLVVPGVDPGYTMPEGLEECVLLFGISTVVLCVIAKPDQTYIADVYIHKVNVGAGDIFIGIDTELKRYTLPGECRLDKNFVMYLNEGEAPEPDPDPEDPIPDPDPDPEEPDVVVAPRKWSAFLILGAAGVVAYLLTKE